MQTIQTLPSNGDEREALRVKGQFWTPPWLAKVMTGWATQDRPGVLFDPAVDPGTFFATARETGFTGEFHGFELHANVFADGWKLGLKLDDFHHIQIAECSPADRLSLRVSVGQNSSRSKKTLALAQSSRYAGKFELRFKKLWRRCIKNRAKTA